MHKSLIHSSENNNYYIYDHQFRLSILVHPELKKVHENTTEVDIYYFKKYEYLKRHGFFTENKPVNFGTLNESVVKEIIIQTPQISFEVTDFCNLNCTYCSRGGLYENKEIKNFKNINTRNAINLLKYFFSIKQKNNRKKLLISFYGGEPLLNIRFIKRIVEIVNKLNEENELDIAYNMTTNATLIHKHIDFLVNNKFTLLISLDGNEKNQSYRSFRKTQKNSFYKVIENLDMVKSVYPEYFFDNISFNSVLHNKNSVKEIFEFIYFRYNKIPNISTLSDSYINPNKKYLFDRIFNSKIKSETEFKNDESEVNFLFHDQLSIYRELTSFLKHCSINYYVSNITALLKTEEKQFPTSTCLPGLKRIFMNVNNKLFPCEKINYKYTIGEVNNNNIDIDIKKITQQYKQYYELISKFCNNCYNYMFCGMCLFHMKYFDKLKTEEFVCEGFHNFETYKNKLNHLFSFLEKYPNDFSNIIENIIIE